MSIWGKVIGGVSGFAIGGPLGAILGVAAGHAIDKAKHRGAGSGSLSDVGDQQVVFTSAVIVLCAKMAKADGQVTSDEIRAFKEIFHIPIDEQGDVGKLFNKAKNEPVGFEPYAKQIFSLFSGQPSVLEELLGALFIIAKADGVIHPKEMLFVSNVAEIFGFSQAQFLRLQSMYVPERNGEGIDPFEVLGIKKDASDVEVKKTYRKLIRDYHPDKLMAHGVPKEFIDLANDKMAAINGAYDEIKKIRVIKR